MQFRHFPVLFFGILFFIPLFFHVYAAASVNAVSVSTASPIIGDSFTFTASISAALVGDKYFVKCRIGANSQSLSDGQTHNASTDKWLDDTGSNGAWIDMPQASIGPDGTWSGTIECRLKSSATDEAKVIYARVCVNSNNSCSNSFQSSNFLPLTPVMPTPTPTLTPTPTVTPSPTPTNTPVPTSSPTPSRTPTPTTAPTPTKTPTPTPKKTPTQTPTIEILSETTASAISVATGVAEVLGTTERATSEAVVLPSRSLLPYVILLLLISLGLGMLSLVFIWKKRNSLSPKAPLRPQE